MPVFCACESQIYPCFDLHSFNFNLIISSFGPCEENLFSIILSVCNWPKICLGIHPVMERHWEHAQKEKPVGHC